MISEAGYASRPHCSTPTGSRCIPSTTCGIHAASSEPSPASASIVCSGWWGIQIRAPRNVCSYGPAVLGVRLCMYACSGPRVGSTLRAPQHGTVTCHGHGSSGSCVACRRNVEPRRRHVEVPLPRQRSERQLGPFHAASPSRYGPGRPRANASLRRRWMSRGSLQSVSRPTATTPILVRSGRRWMRTWPTAAIRISPIASSRITAASNTAIPPFPSKLDVPPTRKPATATCSTAQTES